MTKQKEADINNLTFEQALLELEGIVAKLERGETGLDEAMAVYARGQVLKDYCTQKLTAARLQVDKINADNSSGNISTSEFDIE